MPATEEPGDYLFHEQTPVGFSVRSTENYWRLISEVKHPAIAPHLDDVRSALNSPIQVRRSRSDESVYLFYHELDEGRWVCAVAKRLNGDGFLITAYVTDSIKEGQKIWPK